MKCELFTAVICLREHKSDYEVLLCDTGDGWSLPHGNIGIAGPEADDFDGESEAVVSAFAHLLDQTNVRPEMIEEAEMIQSKLWFVSDEKDNRQACLVYYSFVDTDQAEEIDKALEEKKGNARFFKYDYTGNNPLPSIASGSDECPLDEWMLEALAYQMQFFNKRHN